MVKESIPGKIMIDIKATFCMTNGKDLVNIFGIKEEFIKDSGKQIE